MKKILQISLIATVSVFLFAGCSGKNVGGTPEDSMSGGYEIPITTHISDKNLHDAITKAGERSGWNMIEFKTTSIIAEKILGDKSASATISFGTDRIVIMKDNSTLDSQYETHVLELEDAIREELQDKAAH
ncbi:hypothetical protein KJ877_01520 [bacterium]|nr:hypothetical protein [bacterium]MBU1989942.1 hypothetical protein [bacterium]